MVEGGHRSRFAKEAVGKLVRAELDRQIATQPCVPRLPHFANAAFADGRDKFIRAEFIAVLSFHGDGWIASIHYIVTSESTLREVSFGAPDGLFL